MNHEHLSERFSALLAGDLDASERIRIEAHLRDCPDCRREYRELRHTVDLLRGLPAPDPPRDLSDRVIARLRAGEARPGLLARCQVRLSRLTESSWPTPVAAVAVGLGVLGILRGMDVSLQLPWGADSPVGPGAEIASRAPVQPSGRSGRAARLIGASAESEPGAVISPVLACLRAGGPTRPDVGPGDPCEHWDSWMVDLGMRDAAAFVVEVEAVPAPDRERVLGRIRDFATRSGSAPLLAGKLRSAGDPRAALLANRIERTSTAPRR
jgi:hypothetical protein